MKTHKYYVVCNIRCHSLLWAKLPYLFLCAINIFLLSCSLLNEKIGPEVDSCTDIVGPNICVNDIIASCVDGQLHFEYCKDIKQACIHVDELSGYKCGCSSDNDCVLNMVCKSGLCIKQALGPLLELSRVEIAGDGNNDGLLNVGEIADVNVWIKNTGSKNALDVVATASSSDKYLKLDDGCVKARYITIEAGKEVKGNSCGWISYKFAVSATCPVNHMLEFILDIEGKSTDEYGRVSDSVQHWKVSFSLEVH